jgi:hypothetical protein
VVFVWVHAVFVLAMRLWLWLPLSLWSTPTQPRSQEASRTLQSQEDRKLLNASRPNKQRSKKAAGIVFAICSARSNVNLHGGDSISHFA